MQFAQQGDLALVTRTTGPTSHFLGLAVSPGLDSKTPIVERVSFGQPRAEVEPFDPENRLCHDVMAAVREVNARWGMQVGVAKIRYCADDPPVTGIYFDLAQALLEHVIQAWDETASSGTHTDRNHDRPISEKSLLEIDRL